MDKNNDFTKNDFEIENKKFNWGYVLAVVIIAVAVVVYLPVKITRTYTDTTQVRLIDAVLVQFEWTAEYKAPLITLGENRRRVEHEAENVIANELNKFIRINLNSNELYLAGKDVVQYALYTSGEVKKLAVIDTVIINKMQFEEQFVVYLEELKLMRQRAVTDSLRADAELKKAKMDAEVAKQRAIVKKYEDVVNAELKKANNTK
jgi:heme/copper-type cytochrome/quinol oxidase subunit 2